MATSIYCKLAAASVRRGMVTGHERTGAGGGAWSVCLHDKKGWHDLTSGDEELHLARTVWRCVRQDRSCQAPVHIILKRW